MIIRSERQDLGAPSLLTTEESPTGKTHQRWTGTH